MPGEQDVVAPPKIVHAPEVAARRLVMEDGIGTPQARQPTAVKHPNAIISLLALEEQLLSIAAKLQKQIAPQRVCRANKRIGNPYALARGRLLQQAVAFMGLDIGNRDGAYVRRVKFRQCLLHDVRRRESRII